MRRVLNRIFCVSLTSIASPAACLPVASMIIKWRVNNLQSAHVLEGVRWTCPQLVLGEGDSLQALLGDWTLVSEPRASCSGVGTRWDRPQGGGIDNPIKFVHFHRLLCEVELGRLRKAQNQSWLVGSEWPMEWCSSDSHVTCQLTLAGVETATRQQPQGWLPCLCAEWNGCRLESSVSTLCRLCLRSIHGLTSTRPHLCPAAQDLSIDITMPTAEELILQHPVNTVYNTDLTSSTDKNWGSGICPAPKPPYTHDGECRRHRLCDL
jgi:hypothetical protein